MGLCGVEIVKDPCGSVLYAIEPPQLLHEGNVVFQKGTRYITRQTVTTAKLYTISTYFPQHVQEEAISEKGPKWDAAHYLMLARFGHSWPSLHSTRVFP